MFKIKRKNTNQHYISKIKQFNKKRIINLWFISILLLMIVFSIVASAKDIAQIKSIAKIDQINESQNVEDFSFQNVEKHLVPGAESTVIYIPQIHKEPTSNMSDSKNDKAFLVQKEISEILNSIIENNKINYIMDETDIYGPMPEDKIGKIKEGLELLKKYNELSQAIANQYVSSGGSKDNADQFLKLTAKEAEKFERKLYLTGGSSVVEVTNSNAVVYGSQNPDTIQECRLRLQDIVKMEKKITSFEKTASKDTKTTSKDNLLGLLSRTGSSQTDPLSKIKDFGGQDLSNVAEFKEISGKMDKTQGFETGKTSDVAANYAPVNIEGLSYSQLKKLYDQKYSEFMEIAKDRRSEEVAQNVIEMMSQNGQKSSVLVFGAQHQEQIVKALNDKKVNVVVITPTQEKP